MSMRADTDSADVYRVAVRTLCDFAAKRGDLDLRFTPSPSAAEGMAGHRAAAAKRGDGYEREVALELLSGQLLVRGRADGYDAAANRLDEVKTFRGDLARQPAHHRVLHWAQAKIYGWMLCQHRGLSELNIALVYVDSDTHDETLFEEGFTAAALNTFFDDLCLRFASWARAQAAHRRRRDSMLHELRFPYPQFRTGQRALAEAVYKASCQARYLMLEAPTGLGKTSGTLFPMLKAMPRAGLDKIFFLTAKSSGRAPALQALAGLAPAAERVLRVVEMVARDKACEYPDKACHGASCPLAAGFYDRLPQAREQAMRSPLQTAAVIREVALTHHVCPYYLSQELVQWSDVVVADYNYYFDQSALLWAYAVAQQWRVGLLVDEAHNLLERGRKMYSAELDQSRFTTLRDESPAGSRKSLNRWLRQWRELTQAQPQPYRVESALPEAWLRALRDWIASIGDYLVEQPEGLSVSCRLAYLEAVQFSRVAEQFGEHTLFDISWREVGSARPRTSSSLCLRNIVPAPFLEPRLAAAHACVLFSATLQPWGFHARMTGAPAEPIWLSIPTPFAQDQLEVRISQHISTRYAERRRTLPLVAATMAEQYGRRPGNYLAFFSSFEYLQAAFECMGVAHPAIPLRAQQRGMSEAEQREFLREFSTQESGIAFAVLGGAFAEGIDLPGEQLVGAFIATLGLPQVNPINQAMRARLDQLWGQGYDYVYTYPGLQKVVQAAGRVIRTPTDTGVIHLLDDRYTRADIQALLPSWWPPAMLGGTGE